MAGYVQVDDPTPRSFTCSVILPEGVADPGWKIGEKVRVIVNHACGTANMHEQLFAVTERETGRWSCRRRPFSHTTQDTTLCL